MAKVRRNPDETTKEAIVRMNNTLVGQHGIVMDGEKPVYVGTFVKAETPDNNVYIQFSDELVLLFTPIMVISVIEDKESGKAKIICNELYIGDRTLREVVLDEVEEPPPPKPPSVCDLVENHGTFTGCEEMTNRFVEEGLIRMEGKVLHVSMDISDQPGCMCGIAQYVEHLESLVRDLLKHFSADVIVFHHTHRTADMITTPEVEAGYKGDFYNVPGAFKGDQSCGTYPIIKGINMRWEPLVKEVSE